MCPSNFQDLFGETAETPIHKVLKLIESLETSQRESKLDAIQEFLCTPGSLNGVFGTPDLDVLSFCVQALFQKTKEKDDFFVIGNGDFLKAFILKACVHVTEASVSENDLLYWVKKQDSEEITKIAVEKQEAIEKVNKSTTYSCCKSFPTDADFLIQCIAEHLKQKESSKNCTHIVIGVQMSQTPKSNLVSELKEKMSIFKKQISITFVENFKWRTYIPGGNAQKISPNFIFEGCELNPKISDFLDFCALLRLGPVGRSKGYRKEDIRHNMQEATKKKEAAVVNCFYKKSSEKIGMNESNFWFSPTRCTFYAKKPDFQTYVPESWKDIP